MSLYANKIIGTAAYCCAGASVLEDFSWSWSAFREYSQESCTSPGEIIWFARARHPDGQHARNELAATFEGDWLLLVDVDHAIPVDLLQQMLHRRQHLGADVLISPCHEKTPPFGPSIFIQHEDRYGQVAAYPNEPFRVAGATGGSILVSRSALDTIRQRFSIEPFTAEYPNPPDFSFFRRCTAAGIPIWCDASMQTPHLSVEPVLANRHDVRDIETTTIAPNAA